MSLKKKAGYSHEVSGYEQTVKEPVGSTKQCLLYYVLCHVSSSFSQATVDTPVEGR